VRMIPIGKRPQQAQKRGLPWLKHDQTVVELMAALPEPVNLMFYLGNRSGLRTGELAGLRMSDLGYLKDGLIRIRYSYDGPLKEDKGEVGKMKWGPAPADAGEFLTVWLKRRKPQGAAAGDSASNDHASRVASRVVFGGVDAGRSGYVPPPGQCQFLDVVVPAFAERIGEVPVIELAVATDE